jgi:hypothetical protein
MFEEPLTRFGTLNVERFDCAGYSKDYVISKPWVITLVSDDNPSNLQVVSNNDRLLFFLTKEAATVFALALDDMNRVKKVYGDLTE